MKRKLLLIVCYTLLGGLSSVKAAYTDYLIPANGWTQVTSTSEIVTDGSCVYVIASMTETTRVVSIAAEGSTAQLTTSTISGKLQRTQVWYIEEDSYNNNSGYSFKNLANSDYYLTAGSMAWDQHPTASSKGVAGTCYSLNFDNGTLTIQTNSSIGTDAGRYWGWWNPTTPSSDSYNLAGNKADANKMTFALYKYQKRSVEKGEDYTFMIENPSFEKGDKTGWTDNTTGDKIDVFSSDALTGKNGTYFAERWWHDSTMDIFQTTQSVPAGHYKIIVLGKAEDGNTINLYGQAGSNSEVTESIGSVSDYSLEVYQATSGAIKLGLKGTHKSQTHVALDNFRLTYLGNAKGELLALQATIDDNYLNNATYTNVGGSERSSLSSAKTLTAVSETAAAYETALSTVQVAIDDFVAAKDNYDALDAINDKITAVGTLTYADPEKKPSTYSASSSSDAASHASSLTTALRAYVESNALGEGVSATDYTSEITNALCPGPKTDTDKTYSSADGWNLTYVRFDGGEGWTGSSTSHDVYYGSNGFFWGNYTGSRNSSLEQVVSDLPTGKYLLTVRARSSGTVPTLYISGNGVQQNITHPNGVFGNGWDDTSVLFEVGGDGTATIRLQAQKESDGTKSRWYNADNFRLVRVGDLDAVAMNENTSYTPVAGTYNVTLTRTFSTSNWATFVVPFDIDEASLKDKFGDGVKVCTISASDKTGVSFSEVMANPSITANTPVIMKVAKKDDYNRYTFNAVEIKVGSTSTNLTTGVDIVANYSGEITIPSESGYSYYYVKSNNLYKSTGSQKSLGFRAYFKVANDVTPPVKAFFDNGFNFDGTDAVKSVEAVQDENAVIYNLAGQRVGKAQKGLYIVNGKKVMVK